MFSAPPLFQFVGQYRNFNMNRHGRVQQGYTEYKSLATEGAKGYRDQLAIHLAVSTLSRLGNEHSYISQGYRCHLKRWKRKDGNIFIGRWTEGLVERGRIFTTPLGLKLKLIYQNRTAYCGVETLEFDML